MAIEGEPAKRYGFSYGGDTQPSFDTATEAFEAYQEHRDLIAPKIGRFDYHFRDGRKEITLEQLRAAAKAETTKG